MEPGGARILDGAALARRLRGELQAQVSALRARGITPGLAVILVGDDPASQVYVRSKQRACQEVGITALDHHLPASTPARDIIALIRRLNDEPTVDGILLQLPLPGGLPTEAILDEIDPRKDVDGLLPDNVGRLWLGRPRFVPCTPLGVMRLLDEAGVSLRGAEAVVVGRSHLVGRPLAALLLQAHATVTMCHSQTRELDRVVSRAEVLVVAIGRPEAIRGAWIRQGATVIDVGINRLPDGRLVGDVEFAEARRRARAITPVPGGVGPMTIAMLLHNTVAAAGRRGA
ncbi:MAG: bifunctional methylenetetrahydrofolate dehydrogenase/methenyltetrahydrofolate cyclohydrolase FolD [Myxococcales bacterium]|nr:bifunctional methylenetetrahydrofolate dehydrogenase/methenyltetrahydrofolate cyclohydrolase FolD [Myxococcota bacterium]MDW8283502.1 bifunctional methylenetetrahydrofolate dehydrogenase/methenyltetrahydrofolate cyclohydrolase FolD [Myxococcales bacterium]